MKIGDKLESECLACGEKEIWEIEGIRNNVEYGDGFFRAYDLRAIKNCFGEGVKTSLKDCPEAFIDFKPII